MFGVCAEGLQPTHSETGSTKGMTTYSMNICVLRGCRQCLVISTSRLFVFDFDVVLCVRITICIVKAKPRDSYAESW